MGKVYVLLAKEQYSTGVIMGIYSNSEDAYAHAKRLEDEEGDLHYADYIVQEHDVLDNLEKVDG